MTTVSSKTRAFATRLSAGLSILALALSSSPAFAAQGLNPTLQEGGYGQALNNFFGLYPLLWTGVAWTCLLGGFGLVAWGFILLKERQDPQKKSQISTSKVFTYVLVGTLLLGITKVANMGGITLFGSGYNSDSIQMNNSNPFN